MVEFLIGLVLFILSLLYFLFYGKNNNIGTTVDYTDLLSSGLCDSPGCVRCDKSNKVRIIALEKFTKYYRNQAGLKRLGSSFTNSSKSDYLFHCDFLTSKPVWRISDLPESYIQDVKLLKENINVFKQDFKTLVNQMESNRSTNWTRYFLFNQGVCDDKNLETCMRTNIILKNCSNLMVDCVFGYQFFSVLPPGASIEEHTGPTNIRLRCHVTLHLPENSKQCRMKVADQTVSWMENGVLMFDDSLLHSVKYTTEDPAGEHYNSRVVLLLDFWHPDLTLDERNCLQRCFSSSGF